jgi:methyltransferase (TIGR00027 family)
MASLIRNISDTARWVAMFRAEESERPDAIFHDPFARRLAGELGEKISNQIVFSKKNSWTFVARTYLFDQYIQQHVDQGCDMVINLAAGLDARPYRMQLPPSLKWIDVDLPGMIEYKNDILKDEKPACQLRSIAVDLADKASRLKLFEKLNEEAARALIVCEGLMIYLTYEEAGGLSSDLASQPHFRRWVMDLQSPGLLVMAQKEMGDQLKDSNARFQFAPSEGEGFFLQYGWKWLESKSKLKTAAVLKRLSDEMMVFAAYPEPEGPKGDFPWTGVCLFENVNTSQDR